jgi:hypothetical protein
MLDLLAKVKSVPSVTIDLENVKNLSGILADDM